MCVSADIWSLLLRCFLLKATIYYHMKLSTSSGRKPRSEPPEPNPFTDEEFQVWRGLLRTHRTITDELNQRLIRKHDLTLLHYGVLITLITDPDRQMRMTDIAERVLTSPSGMTRAIARLAADGLVNREQDESDRPLSAEAEPEFAPMDKEQWEKILADLDPEDFKYKV